RNLSFRCYPTRGYSLYPAYEHTTLYGSDMTSRLSHRGLSSTHRCVTFESASFSKSSTLTSGQLPGTSSLLFHYYFYFFFSLSSAFLSQIPSTPRSVLFSLPSTESSDLSRLPFDLATPFRNKRQTVF